jgi:predicted RNase H-like nuclease (RuvC/YqgF family)
MLEGDGRMSEYCENCKQLAEKNAELTEQLAEMTAELEQYKRAFELANDESKCTIELCTKYRNDERCKRPNICSYCCLDRAKEKP